MPARNIYDTDIIRYPPTQIKNIKTIFQYNIYIYNIYIYIYGDIVENKTSINNRPKAVIIRRGTNTQKAHLCLHLSPGLGNVSLKYERNYQEDSKICFINSSVTQLVYFGSEM